MKWHKPSQKKPKQGKKVLCMHKGDFYVAQRFKDCWFSIPFYDSKYSRYFEPELWMEIDFPKPFSGFMWANVNGKMYDMDSLEEEHPDVFKTIMEAIKLSFDKHLAPEFHKELLKD
jgi:hypothetical protein